MASRPDPATYHGHRQRSYSAVNTGELVELRARQRTFDNAYLRTGLLNLSYSVLILKLFDSRFYDIGLIYVALASLLLTTAYIRRRHSNRDFSDQARTALEALHPQPSSARVWGRPFATAGWIVVQVTTIVASVQVVLLVLLLRL